MTKSACAYNCGMYEAAGTDKLTYLHRLCPLGYIEQTGITGIMAWPAHRS